jgi:hypothetical protein
MLEVTGLIVKAQNTKFNLHLLPWTLKKEKNNGPAIVKPTFVTMKLKHILVETSQMLSTYSKYL